MNCEFFAFAPRPELSPFVELVWGVRGFADHSVEAVLPNGAVELMVSFGPEQRIVEHGERRLDDCYREAWLAGIQDRRLVHASDHGADHIAVHFRPGGAHAFFDIPMHEATNRVIDLDLLVGRAAVDLRDRLGDLAGDRARAEALQDWLLERRRVHASFAVVSHATEMLRGGFRTSVADVCDRLGMSNKHLVHQFRTVVGLPPKVVGRITRFQRVIAACRGRQRVDWVDLAHAHGYADQSHLIREFRRLGGVTPTEFLDHRTPDESHVVMDR